MACNYLWTLRRRFAAQDLLISQKSVDVFYYFSLKFRVIFCGSLGDFERLWGIFFFIYNQHNNISFSIHKMV